MEEYNVNINQQVTTIDVENISHELKMFGTVVEISGDYREAVNQIENAKNQAVSNINTAANENITNFNNAVSETLRDFNETAQDKINQTQYAVAQANQSAQEAAQSANSAQSVADGIQTSGAEQIEAIENAGQTQVEAVNQASADGLTEISSAVSGKIEEYNQNAQEKTMAFDENFNNETIMFNDNAARKQAIIDASVAEAKQWAIGEPDEPEGYSSKYWAEKAKEELSGLEDDLVSEIENRQTADEALEQRIDNEVSRAEQAESNLSSTISNEVTRAQTAEQALDDKIDQLNTDLSEAIQAEEERSETAESVLQDNIDSEASTRADEITRVEGLISDEISRAMTAESTIAGNLSSEITRATNAENTISGNLTAETNRATAAEEANATSISNHISDKNNPHEVTKTQIGLGNVDNTSDVNKPVSTAQQAAIDTVDDKVDTHIADTNNPHSVTKAQVGLGNVDNTSDLNKPISTAVSNAFDAVEDEINTINSKIPTAATSLNQLADKDFVNSSIASATATFIGTFNSVAELEAYSGVKDENDYAFVISTDGTGNTVYNRYKWNDTAWLFEYALNNSSFTANQWAAINSGATTTNINQIATNTGNITTLNLTKQDNITSTNKLNADLVDDTTSTNKFVTASDISSWDAKQNTISDLATIRAGAQAGATALQSGDNISELTNDSGYITGINASDVTTALGYTPYNSTNPNGYQANVLESIQVNGTDQTITNKKVNIPVPTNNSQLTNGAGYITSSALTPYALSANLATVATSGSYNDLNDKPTIGNGTFTIQANGTDVATFTANQTGNTTANISIPDSATWGNITGTLSNQTDLQNALNTKANNADVVHKTGNETIDGQKIFTTGIKQQNNEAVVPTFRCNNYTKGTRPTNDTYICCNKYLDKDDKEIFSEYYYIVRNTNINRYILRLHNNSSADATGYLDAIAFDFTGTTSGCRINTATATAPTPSASDNSNNIATTAYVKNQGYITSSDSITGSAAKLTTKRTIDGVEFDGSANIIHYGTCSTAAATAAKEVACTGFKLETGALINVRFTVTNTASPVTLNVNSTGAKGLKYRNGDFSAGYLSANRTYAIIYDGTYYQIVGDFDTNTLDQVRYTNKIKAAAAIAANKLVVGTSAGYKPAADGVTFDISYPILWAASAINSGATNNNVFKTISGRSVRDLTGNTSWTGTQWSTLYLVLSALNGVTATIDSTLVTTTVPTSADNKYYIPLGLMYSTYQVYFDPSDKIYAYTNGKFQRISIQALRASQDGSGNTITSYYQPKLTSGTNIKTINGNSLLGSGNLTVSADTSNCVKKTELSEVQCVVETYHNDTSWYRVWSDGWIEQGGSVNLGQDASTSITLLKAFSNTNATVIASNYHNGNHDTNYMNSVSVYLTSKSVLKISHLSAATSYRWYACGY